MKKWLEKIEKRNDRLLKHGRRYHTLRDALLIFATLATAGRVMMGISSGGFNLAGMLFSAATPSLIVIMALAYVCHIRAQHIESLAFYRFLLKDSPVDLSRVEIPETNFRQWLQSHSPL